MVDVADRPGVDTADRPGAVEVAGRRRCGAADRPGDDTAARLGSRSEWLMRRIGRASILLPGREPLKLPAGGSAGRRIVRAMKRYARQRRAEALKRSGLWVELAKRSSKTHKHAGSRMEERVVGRIIKMERKNPRMWVFTSKKLKNTHKRAEIRMK